jgi:hypothetical protein
LMKIPLEVPPRRKEAGIGLATPERDEEHLADRKRLVADNGARIRHSDAITYYCRRHWFQTLAWCMELFGSLSII